MSGLTSLLGGRFALSSSKTVVLSPELGVLTSSWMDRRDASEDDSSFIAAFTLPLLISLAKDLVRLSCLCEREVRSMVSLCCMVFPSLNSSEMLPSRQSPSLL